MSADSTSGHSVFGVSKAKRMWSTGPSYLIFAFPVLHFPVSHFSSLHLHFCCCIFQPCSSIFWSCIFRPAFSAPQLLYIVICLNRKPFGCRYHGRHGKQSNHFLILDNVRKSPAYCVTVHRWMDRRRRVRSFIVQRHDFCWELQVAQLWQRDRASTAIIRGWVTLRLNFRLKGYVSRQYLWTVR